MPSRGSTGNVIAALCSLVIPGLGQLIQGRLLWAIIFFILGIGFWTGFFIIAFIIHIWAAFDAARFKG